MVRQPKKAAGPVMAPPPVAPKSRVGEFLKSSQEVGPPHVIVTARAGTGKSTTLVEGMKVMRGIAPKITPSPQQQMIWKELQKSKGAYSIAFAAFGRAIAEDLKSKVPEGCEAMTLHVMGGKVVRKAFPFAKLDSKGEKIQLIVEGVLGRDIFELRRNSPELLNGLIDVAEKCKMNLISGDDREEVLDIIDHFGIDTGDYLPTILKALPRVLEMCKDVNQCGCYDFNDMIWLPVVLNLPQYRYDVLMVDECLPGWTPVMLGSGGSKPISEILVGDIVRSFNVTTGRAMNCKVTATQKLPNRKPLVKVKVKHNHKTEGNRKSNFVVCTIDHKIWTVNKGWTYAEDLKEGDTVIIETSAETSQKGKISASGRDKLSAIHLGNTKGLGNKGGDPVAFNSIKGGNGRGPTEPQELLFQALGEGWYMEYVVKTGDAPQYGRGDRPSHYKIDLAHPEFKIAVEIDGASHTKLEEADLRKDQFLESEGWTVFRYKNRDVAKDFAGILQDLCPDGRSCPMPATVESVDDAYISENFVYDITVEHCHNFYGNGVLVHNCQDLNRCQQELAFRSGKRLILIGDPKQAIFGFAGADATSMPRMTERLGASPEGCVELSLNKTFRCGKKIVAEAQNIVPDFYAHDTNPEGKVRTAKFMTATGVDTYRDELEPGDMVLCRNNGPLISQCFKLMKAGKRANILGREIGQGVIKLIMKLMGVRTDYQSFVMRPDMQEKETLVKLINSLSDWSMLERQKESSKKFPSEIKIQNIQDRADCIEFLCTECQSVADVCVKINDLFSDSTTGIIKLASIHKSKGLEARRVFFINHETCPCPSPMAKSAWEREQEMNLLYVATTRAIEELIYVR